MPDINEIPEVILKEVLSGLVSQQVEDRLQAITRLSQLPYSNQAILRQLEKMAIKDRSKTVRSMALDALDSPVHRQIYLRTTSLPKHTRQVFAKEIQNWQTEGLLNKEIANTIKSRYTFDFQLAPIDQAPAAHEQISTKPKPTLSQTLVSETSIKIALYLGAFFVIAAAMIFAAAIEELRLPILTILTVAFGGGSLVIKKRLPQPSFTLFIVFSVLLPIDFNVIADQLNFNAFANSLYWTFVFALMALVWAFATWLFRSRFFSLTTFIALGLSFGYFADLFNDSPVDLYLLMLTLAGLVGLAGVKLMQKWQDEKFANPLFWLAQAQQIILLFIALFVALNHIDDLIFENGWWLATTAFWYLAAIFYIASRLLKEKLPFQYLAVLSILPLTWLFLNIFDASNAVQIITAFVWGALFAGSGEAIKTLKNEKLQIYGQPLTLGSIPLVGAASIAALDENTTLGFIILLGGTLLYTLLTFFRARWWTWSLALGSALAAYFTFFELDFALSWDIYAGYLLLISSLILLLPDMILKPDFKHNLTWRLPPRLFGALLTLINTITLLFATDDNLIKAAIIFGIYALLFFGYALRYFPQYAYNANGALFLVVIYVLRDQNATRWLAPLISLSVLYYVIGLGLERAGQGLGWVDVYRYSGMAFATGVAVSAPFEDSGLAASLPVVIAAVLFTVEAFKKRNVWLGFPANALYLMAYFMILLNFEVDQPQFFSVGAAVLGMLMHYLLVRSGSKTGAFVTGMLSQLTLLSTTYIQMVAEEKLLFFAVLFFQALVVLVYGIVIRSRSLVITPIIFLVIGVLTITFGLLEGLPSILLIGCTGVFLIAFGIGALLLREKFTALRDQLDHWNA